MRIAHVISEFSGHEAMGRTIVETVGRIDAEHHLVCTQAHDGVALPDGSPRFASVHEVGGDITTFVVRRGREVATALDEIGADVVHLHGGALTPLWAQTAALRGRTLVQTVYGWPRVPRLAQVRRARVSFSQLRTSNVLRARVLLTTALPASAVRRAVRSSNTLAVLSPDPDARLRLAGAGVPVMALPSGAAADSRRARFDSTAPTALFAGRAENVRGIGSLLRAFATVHAEIPTARLRLLLIPTAELPEILAAVEAARAAGLGDAVEVCTEAVADLTDELSAAQVGVWPFAFDYTTSPPAMAVAEAMAVGLPVVSTPVTCVRSIAVDDLNADLIPVGDDHALARAITGLMLDHDRWSRRSTAGVHTIETTASWEAAMQVTRQAYGLPAVTTSDRVGVAV